MDVDEGSIFIPLALHDTSARAIIRACAYAISAENLCVDLYLNQSDLSNRWRLNINKIADMNFVTRHLIDLFKCTFLHFRKFSNYSSRRP